jgi:hypothetical protein
MARVYLTHLSRLSSSELVAAVSPFLTAGSWRCEELTVNPRAIDSGYLLRRLQREEKAGETKLHAQQSGQARPGEIARRVAVVKLSVLRLQ